MGKPERKARERVYSSSSYFLRCFGVSRKIHSDKPMVETGQEKKKKNKTRSRWFLRATKNRFKDGEEITTTPIYEAEKQNSNVEDDKQNLFRVIRHMTDQKNVAASGYKQETKEKDTSELRDINPEPLSLSGYDTCHEQVSTTFRGGKLDPTRTVGYGSKPRESREKSSSRVRKASRVDPVIGISIIMLTLVIMLMWGRLCAILCTSAWCYFLPRLKEAAVADKRKRSAGGKAEAALFPDDLDFNSQAYKKKVVLEGFLLRQHRV
ncbi:unnamed protein product [Thlaspi arvense]|uniref:Uncharacterized protein n=1 Tax=Thlaspi arvense TaxID=13288 RepID=A0AAU9RMZ9_THLAR|nr:unnamed protein product [Thlaspi arvense]